MYIWFIDVYIFMSEFNFAISLHNANDIFLNLCVITANTLQTSAAPSVTSPPRCGRTVTGAADAPCLLLPAASRPTPAAPSLTRWCNTLAVSAPQVKSMPLPTAPCTYQLLPHLYLVYLWGHFWEQHARPTLGPCSRAWHRSPRVPLVSQCLL